jgi:hypothetical protein
VSRRRGVGRAVVWALVLVAAAAADADVLELDTGERITGELREAGRDSIVFESGGHAVTYERARVRAILLTPTASVTAAPSVSPAEALAALKRLQDVTRAGPVDLRAYTTELTQNRPAVEKYLTSVPETTALRAPIADALGLYDFAAKVWASRLTNSASASAEIGRHPIIERCPALQRIVDQYPSPTTQENAWRRGVALEFELPAIWGCAGDKVAEADAGGSRAAPPPPTR